MHKDIRDTDEDYGTDHERRVLADDDTEGGCWGWLFLAGMISSLGLTAPWWWGWML